MHWTPTTIRTKFEALGLGPITRKDIVNVLVNPFVEKYNHVKDYALREVDMNDDGSKGMSAKEFEELVEEVAIRCLEIACKVFLTFLPTICGLLQHHRANFSSASLTHIPS